jgi:Eco57I restriction-modification methylase
VPTSGTLWEALRGVRPHGALFGAAVGAAGDARAFHWPLEFPDVMARGGFDVVIGNPPWEVMQLSDKEYFETRKPEIAALVGAARKRAIKDLEHTNPPAFLSFAVAKRGFDAINEFARASGRFDLTARGKVNTYGLFAVLFMNLSFDRAAHLALTPQCGFIPPVSLSVFPMRSVTHRPPHRFCAA